MNWIRAKVYTGATNLLMGPQWLTLCTHMHDTDALWVSDAFPYVVFHCLGDQHCSACDA